MDSTAPAVRITKEEKQAAVAIGVALLIAFFALAAFILAIHQGHRVTAVDNHAWDGVRKAKAQTEQSEYAAKLSEAAHNDALATEKWATEFAKLYGKNQTDQAKVNAAVSRQLKAQAKQITDLQQKLASGARIVGEHK